MGVAGCAAEAGNTVGAVDALRTRAGICSKSTLNGSMSAIATNSAQRSIETCLRVGMPGTLADDGRTPFIATMVTGDANAPNADAGNWQVEVFYNGAPMGKRMMARAGVPQLTCGAATGGAPCDSWSTDLMQWAVPFAPGTYVFRYTFALDTSVTTTNTITIGGQAATAVASDPREGRWAP